MISVLIINYNCLQLTKNIIGDLDKQTQHFELTIVDQHSTESGTKDFLDLSSERHNIIINDRNIPINHIWNKFVMEAKTPYVSILNNDIKIPKNFLKDIKSILDNENEVDVVIHPTNHLNYQYASELSYKILERRTRQGWRFTFRKENWTEIPSEIEFYCGDDFIFENVYMNKRKVAMALSSPMIHLLSQTRKINGKISNINPNKDIETYKKLGYNHYLNILPEYSNLMPCFDKIIEK